MDEGEARSVLNEIAQIAGSGNWMVLEPLYFGPPTEEEVFAHTVADPLGTWALIFESDEFQQHLREGIIGFDWTGVYFFDNARCAPTLSGLPEQVFCQIACQCIDSSDWYFETSLSSVERTLQTTKDFEARDSWGLFPPRFCVG